MLLQSYSCVLCNLDVEETVHHLFLHWEFTKQCWGFIGVDIPLDAKLPNAMTFLRDAVNS
jgi:hypothetical protein